MQLHRFKTITQYHRFRNLQNPKHPLLSVHRIEDIKKTREDEPSHLIQDFYMIALKKNVNVTMGYGQREYDFNEGTLIFLAPNQIYSIEANVDLSHTGWILLVHPDFFWKTSLMSNIKDYDYFGYAVNEALHLSDKEEEIVIQILKRIESEYTSNIDKFSKPVIVSHMETLLNYANRFYHRQFITREKVGHQIVARLEKILVDYYDTGGKNCQGPITVSEVSVLLNVSPNYLSSMLKVLTGKSTQQHIHEKLIEKAKERLANSALSINEIAYELGFEYSQSFSKLFKSKTELTPTQFSKKFD